MPCLHRSMIGALTAVSLVGLIVPGAVAEETTPPPEPTVEVSAEPTAEPTATPTATPSPTATPTAVPTPTPQAPASGWKIENGRWFFYEEGVKRTGWLALSGSWYY